jgi:hypothetical protein
MALIHRVWFVTAFLGGLLFIMAVPPFQIGEEPQHWMRIYSPRCDKAPQRARQLVEACLEKDGKFHFAQLDAAMAATSDAPEPLPPGLQGACKNAPTAYLFPSLMTRLVELAWPYDKGATLMAFYGARLANWLTLSIGVWLLLLGAPLLRGFALFVYSLPHVMMRGASLNQDACVLFLVCLVIVSWRKKVLFAVALLLLLYTFWKLLPAYPAGAAAQSYGWILLAALLALASDAMGKAAPLLRQPERALWQNVAAGAALAVLLIVWQGALEALRHVHYLQVQW